jgi:hypothetical protein
MTGEMGMTTGEIRMTDSAIAHDGGKQERET